MYNKNTKVKGVNRLTSMAVAALLFLIGFGSVEAQYPRIPVLTLTGQEGGYNDQWFENGRILLPRNTNYDREFLVPVFIDNRWADNPDGYSVDLPVAPITSFNFKLFYDSATVRPIGVETVHPKYIPRSVKLRGEQPLAAGFQIDWHDDVNKDYFTHIDSSQLATINRGRAVTISAASNKPLPNTDLNFQQFRVLLYVRFKAVLNEGELLQNSFSYFHIGRDSITYNDLNVLQEAPFVEYRDYDTRISEDFPDPQRPIYESPLGVVFSGLAGMDNRTVNQPENKIIPGGLWFQYMTDQPSFAFEINRQLGQQPPIVEIEEGLYEIVDPFTVDLNANRNQNPYPNVATRIMEVLNGTELTLLKNIHIVSDKPWLQFDGRNINGPTTEGFVPYLDNGLLGEDSQRDELNEVPDDEGPLSLTITCDPAAIQAGDDLNDDPEIEKTGIYTGYITFSSDFAEVSPVRIKVTFIYFRPPLEGQDPAGSRLNGIPLTLTNVDGESSRVVFGTGDRATLGVDSLYGEHAKETELSSTEMEARFYPVDEFGEEVDNIAPFGFGDFATSDEQLKSNSRDIRSSDDTTRSLIYKVKFNPGADNKNQRYPVIIKWNKNDFIDGSAAFIRDTKNGQLFAPVNMITEGTPCDGPNEFCFKIDDPNIREFIIEYTPAKLIEYTDFEGNPLINPGWNLLSLPVKPLGNANPWINAINERPYYFFLNSYQQEDGTTVRPGVGYFVKYGPNPANIPTTFRGTSIFEVSPLVNPVRVYVAEEGRGGWNTVGAPTTPINVEALDFRAFGQGNRPDKNYMLQHGVWKYMTKEGYKEVSELQPGLGYWLKVDADGYYYFNTANAKETNGVPAMFDARNSVKNNATQIVVSDNNQSSKALYVTNNTELNSIELPPLPPSFDVRFDGNTEMTNSNESIIKLTNVEYPVSISAKGMNGTFELRDAATNEYFGTISSDDFSSVEIESSSNSIKLNRVETEELSEVNNVYPNPVVSEATISFNAPVEGNYSVSLINSVGNTVANLYNGNVNESVKTINFNANGFASGNYFVKVQAGSYNKIMRLQIVK
ncbi:MAG: T9SS type A sorting domain-containing protein [Chlorobiota bacterium]